MVPNVVWLFASLFHHTAGPKLRPTKLVQSLEGWDTEWVPVEDAHGVARAHNVAREHGPGSTLYKDGGGGGGGGTPRGHDGDMERLASGKFSASGKVRCFVSLCATSLSRSVAHPAPASAAHLSHPAPEPLRSPPPISRLCGSAVGPLRLPTPVRRTCAHPP